MKIALVKEQGKDKPCMIDNNEPLQTMKASKTLELKITSNDRLNECKYHKQEKFYDI